MRIVIVGIGAIGGTVAGWLGSRHEDLYVFDRPAVSDPVRANGITVYEGGGTNRETARVKVLADLGEVAAPDVVVLAVKNYSLAGVAETVKGYYGDAPIVVGLQNGVDNQSILPRFFSKVVYGVIGYNAWLDGPGVVGYQKRGPILLGTKQNELQAEVAEIARVFSAGFPAVVTTRLGDAEHSKLILNLTNSFTTLIGHNFGPISSPELVQRCLANVLYEGVQIVRAAGYRECRIAGMPGWWLIVANAKLPQWLTRPLFTRNLRKMVISSMAQDVISQRRGETELESINGYIVRLADKTGVAAPYNRALYAVCKDEFAKPDFQPLDVKEAWRKILERRN